MRYEAHKNLFFEKIFEIFGVWIDFTPARFNRSVRSMQQRVASFYAESNSIFGNFLRQILKISKQIKWMCQLKGDSLASLVHNNLFSFSFNRYNLNWFPCNFNWFNHFLPTRSKWYVNAMWKMVHGIFFRELCYKAFIKIPF